MPSDREPLVAAAAQVIGGPLGRFARVRRERWGGTGPRRGLWVPAARPAAAVLAFAAAAMVALGMVQKSYCATHGWGGTEVFWRACYSDLPRMYVTSGLITNALPYADPPMSINQPAGTGLVLWVLAHLVPTTAQEATWFVAAWAILAAALAAGLAVATVRTMRRDPWRAAQVALCPLLITVVLVGPDLLGILLVSIGLLWWARDKMIYAGLALGLAMSARSYAVLVVIVLVLIAARAGVLRDAARMAGVALLTWLAVVGGVGLVTGPAVLTAYQTWLGSGAEYGAPVFLLNLMGVQLPLGALTAFAIAGWIVAVLGAAALTLLPAHRPRVGEVLVVVMVLVLLTGKAIPVQATLLLAPLLVLAVVPWRDVVLWWAAEVLYFVAVWLYLGGLSEPTRALPAPWYALFLVLRVAIMAYLAFGIIRRIIARPAALPPEEQVLGETPFSEEPFEDDSAAMQEVTGEEADALALDPDLSPAQQRDQADLAISARRDPDDAAGPAAGRPDALVVTFG